MQAGVRCGAIDRQRNSQAFALGFEKGQIQLIRPGGDNAIPAPLTIENPFASFDKSFRDFSGLAKIGEKLLQLDRDGVLKIWNLGPGTKSPVKINTSDLGVEALRRKGFEPMIAVDPNHKYFVTSDPDAPLGLIGWLPDERANGGFRRMPVTIETISNATDLKFVKIRGVAFAPNGQYLAIIIKDSDNFSRPFVFALPSVNEIAATDDLALSQNLMPEDVTAFRVKNPAFIQFSADSSRLSFHYFTDRSRRTNVERYILKDGKFASDTSFVLDRSQEWSILDWQSLGADDRFLVRRNELVSLRAPDVNESLHEWQGNRNAIMFDRDGSLRIALLKEGGLDDKVGELELRNEENELLNGGSLLKFKSAVGLQRVGPTEFVVLDDQGLHLVTVATDDGNPTIVGASPMIEAEVACTAIDLCGSKLVATYSNGETIVYDLDVLDDTKQPTRIATVAGLNAALLSADGNWLAGKKDGSIVAFNLKQFDPQKPNYSSGAVDGSGVFAWLTNVGEAIERNELLCLTSTPTGALTWQIVDPGTQTTRDPDATWTLPTEIRDENLKGQIALRSLELSPQTNEYVAVGYGTQDAQSSADGHLKVARRGTPGWIKEVDDALDGRNILRSSFSQIAVGEAAGTPVATRMALLLDDQGTATPTVFMLAHREFKEAEPVEGEAVDPNASAQTKVEFRFVEFQNLLTELRQHELIDLDFSGDGRTLLSVGKRATRALLSEVPSLPDKPAETP
jgi:hypothetical protein